MSLAIYKNKKRHTGTQSETPSIHYDASGKGIVGGYQKFSITKTQVIPISYASKFMYISKFLTANKATCSTIADIGASTGIVCFMANLIGYKTCYALDHDKDCLKIVQDIKDHFSIKEGIIEKEYSFGDQIEPVDIVIACALIHWVFSCTTLWGSFDKIIGYLRKCTKKILLIEWVDATDVAVRAFKHTSFNKGIIKEAYTRGNFIKSLQKHFAKVEKTFTIRATREIFICKI